VRTISADGRRPRRRGPVTVLVVLALLLLTGASTGTTPASADRVGDAAIRWAQSQNGHREVGTSNCSSRITRWERDMGLNAPPCRPWCGAFVHQAFLRAGVRLSPRLIDPGRSYDDAVAGRRGIYAISKSDVRPGDLLFFALRDGSSRASHLAIVTTRPNGGKVRTVEGNIAHHVTRKTRGLRYAVLAARVRR
jgi:cell wall-associated NlpC family hydrolase